MRAARSAPRKIALLGAMVIGWFSACDGDLAGRHGGPAAPAGSGGADSVSEQRVAACARWAASYCPAQATCRPLQYRSQYADEADCEAIESELCVRQRFLPGTGWTAEAIDACVAALDWTSCHAVLAVDTERAPIPECSPEGTLGDGETCLRAMQCQGGACVKSGGQVCGKCAQAVPAGGPCQDETECGPPLTNCFQGTCWRRGEEGAPCPSSWACAFDLECQSSKCVPRRGIDEPCGTGASGCQGYPEPLACNEVTGRCDYVAFPGEGESCGVHGKLANGQAARCAYPFGCKYVNPVLKEAGACRPHAARGEPCDSQWGYSGHCAYPLLCFLGACAELDGALCSSEVLPP